MRLFQGNKRSVDELCNIIKDTVRMRLLGLKIFDSKNSYDASKVWGFRVIPKRSPVNDGKGKK